MNKEVQDMLQSITRMNYEIHEIKARLADMVLQQPAVADALKDGLVKLNFAAPRGFYKMLHRNY